ncbi:MAG: OmpA family protein [Candidatus Acidiferrales bacterium]|jgi:outer membrane protein OmpA-like peptidoglycan-associated protein
MRRGAILLLVLAFLAMSLGNAARARNNTAQNQPTYHVTMTPGTIVTINYQHRSGSTTIGFQGSPLLPFAKGQAKVNGKVGRIQINAQFSKLEPAQKFGNEYLTYVLWAITPEGKSNNLGEILLDGDKSKIDVTTSLQTFGLIVTAEPYFAVSQPSNVVVLQNVVLPETSGTIDQAPASYQLLDRGAYSYEVSKTSGNLSRSDNKVPLELFEAQNAVQIAINAGAQKYAPDALNKAQTSLTQAQDLLARNGNSKLIIQASRDAVQNAADARHIAVQRQEDERMAQERADAAQREADAKARADAAAASQQQEAAARQQAEIQRLQAERDAAQSAAATARADADRLAAQQQAERERQNAEQERLKAQQAQDAAAQSELEKQQLRAQLLEQFNRILPTTDTPRGLKVNMADVLFAFGKYDLRPAAREALAKLSGIVLGHPGLKLSVEGYTDSIGSDEVNQTLSEKRAGAVRDYLVQQGVDPSSITATGFGKSNPVASNDTNEGRQQNRRVEIIISGEVIGTQIGGAPPAQPQ